MNKDKLRRILTNHELWLETRFDEEVKGERADLSDTNLNGVNLSEANLSDANLSGAILIEADMRKATINYCRKD